MDAGTFSLSITELTVMDINWTENLSPDEAQAALESLNANKAPTAREAVELLKLKRALEEGRKTLRLGACLFLLALSWHAHSGGIAVNLARRSLLL
jgi:hypothetical protein